MTSERNDSYRSWEPNYENEIQDNQLHPKNISYIQLLMLHWKTFNPRMWNTQPKSKQNWEPTTTLNLVKFYLIFFLG